MTCPEDVDAAREVHERAKVEAFCALEGAIPATTPQGLALVASARPWPEIGGYVGECACGTSLVVGSQCKAPASQSFGLTDRDG